MLLNSVVSIRKVTFHYVFFGSFELVIRACGKWSQVYLKYIRQTMPPPSSAVKYTQRLETICPHVRDGVTSKEEVEDRTKK